MPENTIEQFYTRELPPPLSTLYVTNFYIQAKNASEIYNKKYIITSVLEGELSYLFDNGEEITIGAGEVCIVSPNVNRSWQSSAVTNRNFAFGFSPTTSISTRELETVFSTQPIRDAWKIPCDNELIKKNYLFLSEKCREREELYNMAIYGRLIEYLAIIARISIHTDERFAMAKKPKALIKGMAFIEENLPKPITLRDISKAAHMGVSRFSELFRAHIGTSPIKYLNRTRLERAKLLLKHSDLTIYQISHNTGFRSPYYFSNAFRKYEGISPSRYRNKTNE